MFLTARALALTLLSEGDSWERVYWTSGTSVGLKEIELRLGIFPQQLYARYLE